MTWPTDLSESRYPGTIQREVSVGCSVEGDRIVFLGSLRDHWSDTVTGDVEEIHSWRVRLETVPPDLTVVAVEAEPGYLPFAVCPVAARSVSGLVGARLTRGFGEAAKEAVGAVDGCTHLLSLLMAIANQRVVANYLHSRTQTVPPPEARARRERMVGACAGWREGAEAISLTRAGRPLPLSQIHQSRVHETNDHEANRIEEDSG
jgi:hypothetical protein